MSNTAKKQQQAQEGYYPKDKPEIIKVVEVNRYEKVIERINYNNTTFEVVERAYESGYHAPIGLYI